ncbi:NAD+ diphosphatase [Pseudobutyrivibrio sp. YE44]|uniref:NAD(+) diphosphatase n=1 Tax=Pseudobutyrivibrio sp. YE44 TaxID=1520802 RepID=UPI000883CA6F|nr:NAD(+) diphosphatase [Pseudobutyrivibrio sp. YE44]SDB55413.1 NAD+ diphosphatase [Pseudobutyrivibrio sp. YE44]
MIQDIFPKQLNNSFQPSLQPYADSIVLVYKNDSFLVKLESSESQIKFPKVKDFRNNLNLTYLFSIDNEDFFLSTDALEPNNIIFSDGYSFYDIVKLRNSTLSPKYYVFAIFTAIQLARWYENTKFCGKCGTPNEYSKTERARVCPVCSNTIYPRINPAVIVGVTNGEKLLLTKYRKGFAHNALVAGFTEIGETVEETVIREVQEETGLKVKNLRYYKSQPWGVASDILLGFFCDVDGDDTITMDESELKYAQWVPRNEIELQPQDYSLTNEMMKIFKEGLI